MHEDVIIIDCNVTQAQLSILKIYKLIVKIKYPKKNVTSK